MKLVVAIIPPQKLEDVRTSLVAREINRITINRVTGHGQGRTPGKDLYRGQEVTPDLHPKIRLEIAVNDDFVEPAIEAIIEGSRSGAGQPGDGKIFVLPLAEVVRIRTGERGSEAI